MSGITETAAKDQSASAVSEDNRTEEYIVAVGLPKGLIYQEGSEETAGVIRIGGQLVDSLTPAGYAVWVRCLTPVVAGTSNAAQGVSSALGYYPQFCQSMLDELFASRYLVRLQLGSRLSREISDLRPIPSGYGAGNSFVTPDKYYVTTESEVSVVLDVIGQALWSLMDGILTLGEIAAEATTWLEIAPELVETGLIYTVVELMNGRCLYLDSAVSL